VSVLFYQSRRAPARHDLLKRLKGATILTVSDMDDFCAMGGIIHLDHESSADPLRVNLVAAQQAGFGISSSCLAWRKPSSPTKGPQ